MTDAELEAALRSASGGTQRGALVVGAGTTVMGVLAGLCGAFRWDHEMVRWKTTMWVAYGGMVCFFLGIGALMIVVALFVQPRKGRELVERVLQRPETISRVWLIVHKHKYNPATQPGQLGTATALGVNTTDQRHYQVNVPGARAREILQAIAARAPQAEIGPP